VINNVSPEDWVRKTYQRQAVDTSEVLRIRNKSSYAAAHVSIAATTGDMTFEQGATTGAANVSTGTNPGSSGVIDISALSTVYDLVHQINVEGDPDWEAWMVDYRPDNDIEVTADNAIFTTNLTDQDCKGANGFGVVDKTSLETAEIFPVGVTLNGPCTKPHYSDSMVLHEVLEIVANVTFGGASAGIQVYECDDPAGSSVLLDTLALVSATPTTYSNSGEPMHQAKGKRLVFQAVDASGAITVPSIRISARSYKFGPNVHRTKLWSGY
jgi:hypothetical protein